MPSRVDRHLRALEMAQQCAAYGARIRTITLLTGVNNNAVSTLVYEGRHRPPRGRPPDSPEWYHSANVIHRSEASLCMSTYRRLHCGEVGAAEALIAAYGRYLGVFAAGPHIGFDRAFDLAAHTDGLWLTHTRSFTLVVCPTCHASFLDAIGAVARSNDACPFCKLIQRYPTDPRIQATFPVLAAPEIDIREIWPFWLCEDIQDQPHV